MADFTLARGDDGVATITFDARDRKMNTLTAAGWDTLAGLVEAVANDDDIRGVLLVSGKSNGFCAGADLDELIGYAGVTPSTAEGQRAVLDAVGKANRISRRLETCGKPVVAVISGLALGGGLELALACHHRVVASDPGIRLGLPEATIGLLPGGGGTQRVPRLTGLRDAMEFLLEGQPIDPARALSLGLVDEIADRGEELAVARRWILEVGDPVAPWDKPGFVLPGGGPYVSVASNDAFVTAAARVSKASVGNTPAKGNIARSVYEGSQVPLDRALEIETRYFVKTLQSPQAKAMIRTLFASHGALRRGDARPAGIPAGAIGKVSVLGAGMMGAGIAYALARAGIETVLIDVDTASAAAGKAYSEKLLARAIAKGVTTQGEADALLALIFPTDDYSAIAGSDVVIETVFEDLKVKAESTARALVHMGPDALFATNTSTIPIATLSQAHPDPTRFIGLHFHSPVDRMELVEVVVGDNSGPAALATALDLVKAIGKTAIIAHDSPFFYTSRVFDTYIREGMEMLADGFSPILIDQIGRMTGMPRGPLELSDDVAIDLLDRIAQQRRVLLGEAAVRRRSDDIVGALASEGRNGRKASAGFYDYAADGSKTPWVGLAERWPVTTAQASPEVIAELKRRLLHRQAVEAVRCLDEGVLEDPRHADVGAVLGWSFPRWTGGPISYVEQLGLARFVGECDALAAAWGPRFDVPASLRRMSTADQTFYPVVSRTKAAA